MVVDLQENFTEEQRESLYQKIQAMTVAAKLRLALVANREARNFLVHDANKMISLAVLRNRRVTETEIWQYAQRRELSEDVIAAIARDPKWKKNYGIRLALVNNPKTPMSMAVSILPHLQDRDLKSVSRDKGVSSLLSRKAREVLRTRSK